MGISVQYAEELIICRHIISNRLFFILNAGMMQTME